MKTRHSVISDSLSIATDGISTIDLENIGPISRITLLPKVINPNAWVAVGHPDEIISKIEIIDGSDVLFSMSGGEARALAYYSTKNIPVCSLNNMALEWSFAPIDIYFGRYLWDKEMSFDPSRYSNPQLKITHAIAAHMTAAATGYVTVVADVFDESPPRPAGMLIQKVHHNLTLVIGAVSYVDLPDDLPIRLIIAGSYSDSQGPEYQVTQIKLSEAGDKHLIFDEPTEELEAYFCSQYPPWHEKVSMGVKVAHDSFWITPSYEQTVMLLGTNDSDGILQMTTASGGQKRTVEASVAATAEGIAHGWCPNGMIPFDFRGPDSGPGDYWDVKRGGGAKFKYTAAAGPDTTPTWNTVIQSYRAG